MWQITALMPAEKTEGALRIRKLTVRPAVFLRDQLTQIFTLRFRVHEIGAPVSDPARWQFGSKLAGSETGAPSVPPRWLEHHESCSAGYAIGQHQHNEDNRQILENDFEYARNS